MSKIRVLIYKLDIHNLQTKTVSFLDQEKILKEVVFNLPFSMDANSESSKIKHYPYPKHFKVRNFCETNFRDFATFDKITNVWNHEIFGLVEILLPRKCSILQS